LQEESQLYNILFPLCIDVSRMADEEVLDMCLIGLSLSMGFSPK